MLFCDRGYRAPATPRWVGTIVVTVFLPYLGGFADCKLTLYRCVLHLLPLLVQLVLSGFIPVDLLILCTIPLTAVFPIPFHPLMPF